MFFSKSLLNHNSVMKCQNALGIIGGMSPASTAIYYDGINRLVNEQKGGNTSAPLIVYSVNFEEIAQYQRDGDWGRAGQKLADIAKRLQDMGAEGIMLATNTMHKVADDIIAAIDVPFLHIADTTAQAILAQNLQQVALLGTAFTMREAFYKDRLASFGIDCLVPDESEQADIHRIIFDELTLGKITTASKQRYLQVIGNLQSQGAKGVVLGCTEIGLLITQQDIVLPMLDTAWVYIEQGARFVLDL